MAMNTIYKWLAESTQDLRKRRAEATFNGTLDEMKAAEHMLDMLISEFADKMEPKQPGSFDKQKFLEMAGVKLPS